MFFSNRNNKDNQKNQMQLADLLAKKNDEEAKLFSVLFEKEIKLEEKRLEFNSLFMDLEQAKSMNRENENDWLKANDQRDEKKEKVELYQKVLYQQLNKKNKFTIDDDFETECFEIDLKEAIKSLNIEENRLKKIEQYIYESAQKLIEQTMLFDSVTKEYNSLSSEVLQQREVLKILEQDINTLKKSIEEQKNNQFTNF